LIVFDKDMGLHCERHPYVAGLDGYAPPSWGDDSIASVASLVLGVAAFASDLGTLIMASLTDLVAGSMSMAAGEYVSVSLQTDAERSGLAREQHELATVPAAELRELTEIHVSRGVGWARAVAEQMTAFDALKAHARDELHIADATASARALPR
jgi:VIT1/CCC1 family predicted Fe2+/Mn2+ transporter